MEALLSRDYAKAWSHQRHMLESDCLLPTSIRCFVQLLGQDSNDWFIPVILQCCRESRLLSYKVGACPSRSLSAQQAVGTPQREQRNRRLHHASPQRLHRIQQQKGRDCGNQKRFHWNIQSAFRRFLNAMRSTNSPKFSSPRAIIGSARTCTRVTAIELRSNSRPVPKARVYD